MNPDPSNNPIHRRSNSGGGVSGNGDTDDRNRNDYYDRFHLNQYYNAVEDEQIYMDEYTTLLHRYNEFIVNGNAMFTRMEQTLRENLARTHVRQYFYYQQSENIRNARTLRRNDATQRYSFPSPPPAAPTAPAAPVASAAPAAPAAAQAAPAATTPASTGASFNEVFPRLLSRYLTTEIEREAREQRISPAQRDIFSMLYTVPIAVRTNTNAGGSGAAAAGAPTNDQINRATLNTVFSRIITPVNATCPISRDEFNDDSEITMIRGCNHIFNRASLREWFVSHSTCPMCRSDIREYRAPRTQQPSQSPQANISIDRVDENEITFSYDVPIQYNNDQIYQDIVNTITGMAQTAQQNRNNNNHDDNDDDIMEVD
jgi:hypothetical protein